MGYRKNTPPPPKPEELLPRVVAANGTTAHIALPCWYLEVEQPEDWHDHHRHDFLGWPAPNHPDHSCQMLPGRPHEWFNKLHGYVDMSKATPIHLSSDYEGYSLVKVSFDDGYTGATVDAAYIDAEEDHIIRIELTVSEEAFADKPHEHIVNVFAYSNEHIYDGRIFPARKDLVARFKLVVTPATPAS